MAKKKNSNYVTEKTKQKKEEQEKARKKKWLLKKVILPIVIAVSVILIVLGTIGFVNLGKQLSNNPDLTVTHHASIEIEGYGTLHVELYGNEAPITVANFVKLAESGFYNDTTFHKIIDGAMAQGGKYDKSGKPKEADTIKGEFEVNGVKNRIKHTEGVLSMARTPGVPNSASSEFFIVEATTASNSEDFDGNNAAFGKVTSGMDIIHKICEEAKNTNDEGSVAKENRPVIKSISIHASH